MDPSEVWEALSALLETMPARLARGARGIGLPFPPGACHLESQEGFPPRLLLPGGQALPLALPTSRDSLVFPLAPPWAGMVLELLPDSSCCPPEGLRAASLRRFYDSRLLALVRKMTRGTATASSARDPLGRVSCRFCRLVIPGPAGFSAGMALYPYQSPEEGAAFLTTALCWFHHCRCLRRAFSRTLHLLAPRPAWSGLLGRLALLDSRLVQTVPWAYDLEKGTLSEVSRQSGQEPDSVAFEFLPDRPPHKNEAVEALCALHPGELTQEKTPHPHDILACRGLPLVEINGPGEEHLRVGWQPPRTLWNDWSSSSLLDWIGEVVRLRVAPSPDPAHPAFRLFPERWLEHQVLAALPSIQPSLCRELAYRQVPTYRGSGRSVLDVLAADREGRLTVLEIKTAEDPAILFQALDYWERVREGALSGAFGKAGYFPGLHLSTEPPTLLLLAPLFRFHRALSITALHLSAGISIQLLEVGLHWRSRLRILRRRALTPGRVE